MKTHEECDETNGPICFLFLSAGLPPKSESSAVDWPTRTAARFFEAILAGYPRRRRIRQTYHRLRIVTPGRPSHPAKGWRLRSAARPISLHVRCTGKQLMIQDSLSPQNWMSTLEKSVRNKIDPKKVLESEIDPQVNPWELKIDSKKVDENQKLILGNS